MNRITQVRTTCPELHFSPVLTFQSGFLTGPDTETGPGGVLIAPFMYTITMTDGTAINGTIKFQQS